MTVLQRRDLERKAARVRLWEKTREELRRALAELMPKTRVFLFGSLTRRGVFNDQSDVDVALEAEPPNVSVFALTAMLEERLRRPVDIVLLDHCRFAARIRNEGETWMS